MKFFSKSLSQALQEAGCVSESGFYYILNHGGYNPNDGSDYIDDYWMLTYKPHGPGNVESVPAFHPWDLCGGSERARENAKIVWPRKDIRDLIFDEERILTLEADASVVNGFPYDFHRHALIDLPEEEQEAYVWKTMRKAA